MILGIAWIARRKKHLLTLEVNDETEDGAKTLSLWLEYVIMTTDTVRIARMICHHMTDVADADLVVEVLHHRTNPSEPQEGVGKGDTRRVVYLIHARRNEMIRMRKEAGLGIEHVEVPLEDYFKAFQQEQFDMMAEYMPGYHFDRTGTATVKLVEDHHCCAIPREHPLSAHTSITLNDLSGQTLLLYRRGITRADDALRDYLLEHGENITLLDIDDYKSSLPMKCEHHNAILIQYGLYRQSFATLSKASLVLPKRFPIDIGFCYRTNETMVLRSFLEVLEEYTEVFA